MNGRLILALASRNVRRNLRRSLLTASSVLLCVALLILGIAWLNGVLQAIVGEFISLSGPVRVVTIDYARKERLLPLHLAVHDVAALRRELAPAAPGGVYPRIVFPALLIKGEDRNAPGIGRAMDAADGIANLQLGERVYAGAMFAAGSDEIVVGRLLAEELDLAVGDEVTMLGKGATDSIAAWNFQVAGLFDAGSGLLNRCYFVDLTVAQRVLDMEDQATELCLFGSPLVYRSALPPEIPAALARRPGLVAQHWLESGGFGAAFGIIKYVIGTIAAIVMFVAALGVLNTMMMAVMERKKELGVLLAQGAPPAMIVAMLLTEAIMLGLAGAFGGAALGSLAGYWLEVHGVTLGEAATRSVPIPIKDVIHADLTYAVVVTGFLLGLVVSIAGALLPAIRAVRIEPVEALRVDA